VQHTPRYVASTQQRKEGLVAWEALIDGSDISQATIQEEYQLQEAMRDPIAFSASSDPDTMYLHEAMRAPDRDQFVEAMNKELEAHDTNRHWELFPKTLIPEGTAILDSVWAMRRKRRQVSGIVYKWKARLNIHGGQNKKRG
jgi:hypothetical protein